jgi:hypothetical protein
VRRSRRADAERLARLRGVQRKREHESRPGCRRRRRGLVGQYRGGEAQHARGYIVQSRPCPLRAVSRRRRVPREAPVGQGATTQGRPGGTAVVLARGVASKSSSLGTDLHGRSRACGVLDQDPLGVCIAVRKVRGRTSTSRTGTTSRRGGLIHAGVRSHLLLRTAGCALLCVRHRRSRAWVLASSPLDRQPARLGRLPRDRRNDLSTRQGPPSSRESLDSGATRRGACRRDADPGASTSRQASRPCADPWRRNS